MELKQLYETAKNQFSEILDENSDFRLEQAEYNQAEQVWEIVVSYLQENKGNVRSLIPTPTFQIPYERVFKKVKINNNNEVVGFYIFHPV